MFAWLAAPPLAGGPIAAVLVLAVMFLIACARRTTHDVRVRGAIVRATRRPPPRTRWLRRARRARVACRPDAGVTLGGYTFAQSEETKHFKLIGTTGTGKSTAIRELLTGALARGDRAVIADPGGAYRSIFYERYREDAILNPFEPGALRWDPFSEIRHDYDVEELASALIPSCEDASAREWRGYARTFLGAIVRREYRTGTRELAPLWRRLTVASQEELRVELAGTPAQPFLEPENARMFCSLRAVAASALATLPYIDAQRGRAFSVRAWVEGGRGVLFLPYGARQIAALRTLIATWIRLAIFSALSRPEEEDQHLWFIVDELDALGAIDGLKDALTRLRKFGGRCVLGFQSIAQVSSTYGSDGQSITENCANTLILRCSGGENGGTAQFASRLIGEREILRRQRSRSRDREGAFNTRTGRRSFQISEQRVTEAAVMPAELEQLPDLEGYLKTASSPEWTRIRLDRCASPWRSTISG